MVKKSSITIKEKLVVAEVEPTKEETVQPVEAGDKAKSDRVAKLAAPTNHEQKSQGRIKCVNHEDTQKGPELEPEVFPDTVPPCVAKFEEPADSKVTSNHEEKEDGPELIRMLADPTNHERKSQGRIKCVNHENKEKGPKLGPEVLPDTVPPCVTKFEKPADSKATSNHEEKEDGPDLIHMLAAPMNHEQKSQGRIKCVNHENKQKGPKLGPEVFPDTVPPCVTKIEEPVDSKATSNHEEKKDGPELIPMTTVFSPVKDERQEGSDYASKTKALSTNGKETSSAQLDPTTLSSGQYHEMKVESEDKTVVKKASVTIREKLVVAEVEPTMKETAQLVPSPIISKTDCVAKLAVPTNHERKRQGRMKCVNHEDKQKGPKLEPDVFPDTVPPYVAKIEEPATSNHEEKENGPELIPMTTVSSPVKKERKHRSHYVAKTKASTTTGKGTSAAQLDPTTLVSGHYHEMKEESEEISSQPANDASQQPGAFAVAGIGGTSNTAWDSGYFVSQNDLEMAEPNEEASEAKLTVDDLVATVIDEDELNNKLRLQVIHETVEAGVVVANYDEEEAKQKRFIIFWVLSLITVICMAIGLSVGLTSRSENESVEFSSAFPTIAPTYNPLPTLQIVQSNDVVRCGIGWVKPLEKDLCHALAAAVLGDPQKVEILEISRGERWEFLEIRRILDAVTLLSTYSMQRDVYQPASRVGFDFSTPLLYEGLYFAGIPEYVECADRLDTYVGVCRDVRICVSEGGTCHDIVVDYIADFNVRILPDTNAIYEMFIKGECNVITTYGFDNSESILREMNYTGNYTLGKNTFTQDPLGIVTRQDDTEWSDIVNWVARSLLAAEEQNITQDTASDFMTTDIFGDEYENMFVKVIQAVGNYGDLYGKHLEHIRPRDSFAANLLNNGSTGLHYSFPLGHEYLAGPDPLAGSTIHNITIERGTLRCGILECVGFGQVLVVGDTTNMTRWQGMDVDYCYALSASLFEGDSLKVEFIRLVNETDGYQALDAGRVDVFAGGRVTMESDVKERTTGKGFTFSMPYFYGRVVDVESEASGNHMNIQNMKDSISIGGTMARAMVTREDDDAWSDFVFWVVSCTIIAEQARITQVMSEDMAEVSEFGPQFKDMHRNVIGAVGNYGDIYERNVESIIPRSGRNLLNENPFGPQMVSLF